MFEPCMRRRENTPNNVSAKAGASLRLAFLGLRRGLSGPKLKASCRPHASNGTYTGPSNFYLQSHPRQYPLLSMTRYSCTAVIGRIFAGKLCRGGPSRDSRAEVESQHPRYASCFRCLMMTLNSLVKHGRLATDHLVPMTALTPSPWQRRSGCHLFTTSTTIPFLSYSLSVGR